MRKSPTYIELFNRLYLCLAALNAFPAKNIFIALICQLWRFFAMEFESLVKIVRYQLEAAASNVTPFLEQVTDVDLLTRENFKKILGSSLD